MQRGLDNAGSKQSVTQTLAMFYYTIRLVLTQIIQAALFVKLWSIQRHTSNIMIEMRSALVTVATTSELNYV